MERENEINLKELIIVLLKKKVLVICITFFITILGIIYAYLKTPIYEAKSVVRMGYIGEKLIGDSKTSVWNLRLIFNVDNKNNSIQKNKPIVSDIRWMKGMYNFIEIYTQGVSNQEALTKNKEVISFLQNEYKPKIDEYILKTNMNIKSFEEKINYIQKVKKVGIEEKIKSLKEVDLSILENKLKFNRKKLEEYQENIDKISKQRVKNDTQNMLSAMQIVNYQNLILDLQNQIENLKKEKEDLLNEQIPKLTRELQFNLPEEMNDLKNKLQLEKLNLTNDSIKNSEIVGKILINDNPINPKKRLIIILAFLTGFILSIFLVFFMEFINSIKKEEKNNK